MWGFLSFYRKKNRIKCTPTSHSSSNSFEHLAFIVKVKVPILILNIYNPRDPADFIETHPKGHTLDLVLYSGLSPDNFETKRTCVSEPIWFYLQWLRLSFLHWKIHLFIGGYLIQHLHVKFSELFIAVFPSALNPVFTTKVLLFPFNDSCKSVLDWCSF